MTDDRTPDHTPDTADQRDERIAALLEVPPLDDVTRRRLVTTALDAASVHEPPRRRQRQWIAAAATIAVVAVASLGVVAVVTDDDDDGSTRVASQQEQPASDEAGSTERDAAPAVPAEPQPGVLANQVALLEPLGDLGTLRNTAAVRDAVSSALRARDAAEAAPPSAPCLDAAGRVQPPPFAIATGTLAGRPVVILVSPTGGEAMTVTVLDADSCRVRSTISV